MYRPKPTPLPILLIGVLLLGVGDSITGPYLVLFVARGAPLAAGDRQLRVGHSDQRYGNEHLTRSAVRPGSGRAPALVAVGASAVGFLLLTTTT